MKKALTVFLMLALIGAVYADEPVANVNVSEFTGNAAVSWGIDLDSGKTGFKNEANATLKLNLVDGGDKSTSGDGIWGELVIKTDGDGFIGDENTSLGFVDGTQVKNLGMKAVVDVAKLHFGPVYVGIKSGDTEVGEYKVNAAIRSADSDNAAKVSNVGPTGFTQGIVIGFANDLFGIDVDFRSYEDDDNQHTGAYSLAGEAKVTPIDGLEVKGGVAYNISDEYYGDWTVDTGTKIGTTLGYSASASYKFGLNDTMYVLPQVGFSGFDKDEDAGDASAMNLVASLLFGWGETEDANAGVPFLDGDSAKKVTPGVSVVAFIPLAAKAGDVDLLENGRTIWIMPSFYSGTIVENLKAAAYADIILPGADDADTGLGMVMGLSYGINAGDITITPKAGVRFTNDAYKVYAPGTVVSDGWVSTGEADDGVFNLKLGVDVAGLIQNTTLSVDYSSRNLQNSIDYSDPDNGQKLGTLNLKAKISF